MTLDTLDYGAKPSGSVSTNSFIELGIAKLNYEPVISRDDVVHLSAEMTDGKTIDLGNYDIYRAKELIRESCFATAEGLKSLFEYVEGL